MTRRIALSVLALVAALLVLAVVPLGISMSDRESDAFRGQTAATARAIAAAAEEQLSDHRSDADAAEQLSAAAARGGCAQVFDAHGAEVLSTPCRAVLPPGVLAQVLGSGRQQSVPRDGRLTLAVPIGDSLPPSGALVFSRSTDDLNDRLITIWSWLGLCGLGALGASVLVAVRLARWVGRPLADLDTAAGRLGEETWKPARRSRRARQRCAAWPPPSTPWPPAPRTWCTAIARSSPMSRTSCARR